MVSERINPSSKRYLNCLQGLRPRPSKMDRLLFAALRWHAFQEPDSLHDQGTDIRLRMEAVRVNEQLNSAVKDFYGFA